VNNLLTYLSTFNNNIISAATRKSFFESELPFKEADDMKVLAVGDKFVPKEYFERALAEISDKYEIRYISLDESASFIPFTESEMKLREYAGSPDQLIRELKDEEVLLVHGAPVTDAVLEASPNLKIVGVARGGPVNVDVDFAKKQGISVISAPGRNAEAVADLTIGYIIMLARGILKSVDFIRNGGVLGESTFEGRQFFGNELGANTLGLIGFGQVGYRVAVRAKAFGMSVLVYDPFVDKEKTQRIGVTMIDDLDQLLAKSDFISLHLRTSGETENFIDKVKIAKMKQGAFLINSARETLVNEEDLYEALVSGHLAGAALDVVRPSQDRSPNPLLGLDSVLITPHIGGATFEAALRGVEILSDQLQEYVLSKVETT
jgi:D-3-phosphoglycerate dehydrogenase